MHRFDTMKAPPQSRVSGVSTAPSSASVSHLTVTVGFWVVHHRPRVEYLNLWFQAVLRVAMLLASRGTPNSIVALARSMAARARWVRCKTIVFKHCNIYRQRERRRMEALHAQLYRTPAPFAHAVCLNHVFLSFGQVYEPLCFSSHFQGSAESCSCLQRRPSTSAASR